MKRRALLSMAAGAAAWPLLGHAQAPGGVKRVGFLHGFSAAAEPVGRSQMAAFLEGLSARGWVRDVNVIVDERWFPGNPEQGDLLAGELLALRPDALVSFGTPATRALLRQTQSIPVVFATVTDPVFDGFLANIARPEGNITGFPTYNQGLGGKWLDLLQTVVPGLREVGVMFNPDTAPGRGQLYLGNIEATARNRGVTVTPVIVRSDEELITSVAALAGRANSGLIVQPDSYIGPRRPALIAEITRVRLPAIHPFPAWAVDGGLIAYGISYDERANKAGDYVGRILNGARIGELPVQEPTELRLVINLRTAQAQGISIPGSLLALADEVIE